MTIVSMTQDHEFPHIVEVQDATKRPWPVPKLVCLHCGGTGAADIPFLKQHGKCERKPAPVETRRITLTL